MPEAYHLPSGQYDAWLATLRRHGRLIAPVMREGEYRFDVLADDELPMLGRGLTRRSPKWVFFPQHEAMLRFRRQADDYASAEVAQPNNTPQVLLGVAPCDAASLPMLDRIFMDNYHDPYYAARRRNTLVIALACARPTSTCFCHALGGGPADAAGADLLLTVIDGGYLLETITPAGQSAAAGWGLDPADGDHREQATRAHAVAVEKLKPIESLAGIEAKLEGLFNHPLWREAAEKCIACGTCTYNCPECHCFDIRDLPLADGGERVRGWDACMYAQFTVHASGHNPRPDQGARWRQRIMHKFSYLPANIGLYGCVGCGRCITSCPVRLDIRQVLDAVRRALPEEASRGTV
ncbi:MAG: 4Fe-4S ferredoxin [Chloroflexi bacterium]|nr:4Fe-4S ferredoxin [Chloroflexota bacterium]